MASEIPGLAPGDAIDAGDRIAMASAHVLDPVAVADALGVDSAIGLSTPEARRRAITAGSNALEPSNREPLWRMLLDAAKEPFVVLLAVAGALAIVVGEIRDGVLVLLGLIPIVGADVVTEYRGERALEALREASAPVARVRRDGAALSVAASELVTGDVALLQAGDVVPADLRIVRSDRLLLDRSVLTGESIPEEGRVQPDPDDAVLTDRHAIAYSGTSVVGGRGEGIVVAIGRATEFGQIAGRLASRELRRSPLQRELDRLVRAFELGNYVFVREHARKLADGSADESVRRAAAELLRRIEPDPLVKILFLMSVALFAFMVFYAYRAHGH